MESKPVSTKQKESLVTILINNVPVSISTKRYNHLIELIAEYMGSKPNQSRIEYINQVINLADKAINESQLKYLLKVIQIELDQLN